MSSSRSGNLCSTGLVLPQTCHRAFGSVVEQQLWMGKDRAGSNPALLPTCCVISVKFWTPLSLNFLSGQIIFGNENFYLSDVLCEDNLDPFSWTHACACTHTCRHTHMHTHNTEGPAQKSQKSNNKKWMWNEGALFGTNKDTCIVNTRRQKRKQGP